MRKALYGPKPAGTPALAVLAVLTAVAQTGPVALKSPGGAIEVSIAPVRGQSVQAVGGQLAYRVEFRGQPVIRWSNLGLVLESSPPLGGAVRIDSSQASSHDETWTPVAGKASPIRNHYNAVRVGALPLGFLGSGDYDAEIYADGPNAAAQPKDSVAGKRRVNARTVLKLRLAPGGGCAIRLVPVR